MTYIDVFFKTPTGQKSVERDSFSSNYKLRQLLNNMTNRLSWVLWKLAEIHVVSSVTKDGS